MSEEFQGMKHELVDVCGGVGDAIGSKMAETTSDSLHRSRSQTRIQHRDADSTAVAPRSTSSTSSPKKGSNSNSDRENRRFTGQDENKRSNSTSGYKIRQTENDGTGHRKRTASKLATKLVPPLFLQRKAVPLDNSTKWQYNIKPTSEDTLEPDGIKKSRAAKLRQIAQSSSRNQIGNAAQASATETQRMRSTSGERNSAKRQHDTNLDVQLHPEKMAKSDNTCDIVEIESANEPETPTVIRSPEFSNYQVFTRHLRTTNSGKEDFDVEPVNPPESDQDTNDEDRLNIGARTNDSLKDSDSEKEEYVPNNPRRYEYTEIDLTGETDEEDEDVQHSSAPANSYYSPSAFAQLLNCTIQFVREESEKIQTQTWTPPVGDPTQQQPAPPRKVVKNPNSAPKMKMAGSNANVTNTNGYEEPRDDKINEIIMQARNMLALLLEHPRSDELLLALLKGVTSANTQTSAAAAAAMHGSKKPEPWIEKRPAVSASAATELNFATPQSSANSNASYSANTRSLTEKQVSVGEEVNQLIAALCKEGTSVTGTNRAATMHLRSLAEKRGAVREEVVTQLSAAQCKAGTSTGINTAASMSMAETLATLSGGLVTQLHAAPCVACTSTSTNTAASMHLRSLAGRQATVPLDPPGAVYRRSAASSAAGSNKNTNEADFMEPRSLTEKHGAVPSGALNQRSAALSAAGTSQKTNVEDFINPRSLAGRQATAPLVPPGAVNQRSAASSVAGSSKNTDAAGFMDPRSLAGNQATLPPGALNQRSAAPAMTGTRQNTNVDDFMETRSLVEKQGTVPSGVLNHLYDAPAVASSSKKNHAAGFMEPRSSAESQGIDLSGALNQRSAAASAARTSKNTNEAGFMYPRSLAEKQAPVPSGTLNQRSAAPSAPSTSQNTTVAGLMKPSSSAASQTTANRPSVIRLNEKALPVASTSASASNSRHTTSSVVDPGTLRIILRRLAQLRSEGRPSAVLNTGNNSALPGRQNEAPIPIPRPRQDEPGTSRRAAERIPRNRSSGQLGLGPHRNEGSQQGYLFQCCVCSKGFRDFRALQTHEDWHKKGFRYICMVQGCEKKFRMERWYNSHTNLVHSSRARVIYRCRKCDKKYLRGYNLRNHIRFHTGEKPLECPDCGARFRLDSNLSIHSGRCKGLRSSPVQHTCPDCPKLFTTKSHLTTHRIYKHGLVVPFRRIPQPPALPVLCKRCNFKSSNGEDGLAEHIRHVNSNNGCSHCCQLFSNTDMLLDHMKEKHGPGPGRPHVCATCYTNFSNRAQLERHLTMHSVIKNPAGKPLVPSPMKSLQTLIINQFGGILKDPKPTKPSTEQARKKAFNPANGLNMNPLHEVVTPPPVSPIPENDVKPIGLVEVNEFQVYITNFCESISGY